MERIGNDVACVLFSYLTIDERLEKTACVSRAWRFYTRLSLCNNWARNLRIRVQVVGSGRPPIEFIQTPSQSPEPGVYRFVCGGQETSLVCEDLPIEDIRTSVTLCSNAHSMCQHIIVAEHEALDESLVCDKGRVRIRVGGLRVEEEEGEDYYDTLSRDEQYEFRKDYGDPYGSGADENYATDVRTVYVRLSVESIDLTAVDLAGLAPISRTHNRLHLVCMLATSVEQGDALRSQLNAIMHVGEREPRGLSMLALHMNPFGASLSHLARQFDALLDLAKRCQALSRLWWFDNHSVRDVMWEQNTQDLPRVVSRYVQVAQAQAQQQERSKRTSQQATLLPPNKSKYQRHV